MNIIIFNITIPLVTLTLLGLLFYFVKNPEKIDRWSTLFYKYFYFRNEKRERKIISSNLDYKITRVAKKINKEALGILPFGIRIKWKKPEEVTSYVQQNEVVVVLKKNDNSDVNIVEACMAFVPKALLPKARNVIDENLLQSIDHYVVKKILSDGSYDSAYNFFMQNVLIDLIKDDEEFEKCFKDISKLDEIGFFTRVLLEEFRRIGSQLFGTIEETKFRSETVKFLEFLREFYLRKPGDPTKLDFISDIIKIGIIFVARKSTLNQFGLEAYTKRIEAKYRAGVQRLFLFSYAKPFEKAVYDEHGFVKDVKKIKDFQSLNQIEKICKNYDYLRVVKKQKYYTKDVEGNNRSAKFILYEFIR